MLQKEFFGVESFNPRPYFDNTILNLSGAAKFEADTVFKPGRYSVDVQAGATYRNGYEWVGIPARIMQQIIVNSPFIIRAYCGSKATESSGGINPYSGTFKVNAWSSKSDVPSVSHIFGNSGSPCCIPDNNYIYAATSGNCLGNGTLSVQGTLYQAAGAGSCLHFMPLGGVFGTNYIFAFHVTASAAKGALSAGDSAGVGSAYGGAGSGSSYYAGSSGLVIGKSYSFNAGSTPYGNGGAGVYAANYYSVGNSGTGIGYGYGGGISANGSGAWFNGTNWQDSRSVASSKDQDGHIIVTYLGPIN